MSLRQQVELALAKTGGAPRLLTDADIAVLRAIDSRYAEVAERAREHGRTRASRPTSSSEAA
jgi:hypothetical protein